MGISQHAVNDLAGSNPGIENVIYDFIRALLSIPPQPRLYPIDWQIVHFCRLGAHRLTF
jgi:hypothetical protein